MKEREGGILTASTVINKCRVEMYREFVSRVNDEHVSWRETWRFFLAYWKMTRVLNHMMKLEESGVFWWWRKHQQEAWEEAKRMDRDGADGA